MIHQYRSNGYNIVLDTFSGSIHVVDDLAYRAIELASSLGPETDLKEAFKNAFPNEEGTDELADDIQELKRQGRLFTEDIFESNAFDLKNDHREIKALCLHVAHTCNLTCSYCFARQGNFQGTDALMSLEVGKRAIDFLIENSGNRHNLEVDFFGGEPLLEDRKSVV